MSDSNENGISSLLRSRKFWAAVGVVAWMLAEAAGFVPGPMGPISSMLSGA